MEVFRLVREPYALPLSGKGAAMHGARWNSAGVELIYAALNRSLAMAEVAVHFTLATLPDDFVMLTLHIPDHIRIKTLSAEELPANWNAFPHPPSTQATGDAFVRENQYAVLLIPSVVTQGDFNALLNPKYPDFQHIEVKEMLPFPFDRRIFKVV
jgi:RES domain-containing protein